MMRARNKLGYSLVEVSLALLVAAIGLVTIFALFPDGLASSRKSVSASEISAFADYVFASMQSMAGGTNETAWDAFSNNVARIPLSHMLFGVDKQPPTQPYVEPRGYDRPMVYFWIPKDAYGEGESGGIAQYKVATFTYTLDIGQTGVVSRYARLEVWPGDVSDRVQVAFGKNQLFDGSTVFYREFVPVQ